MAPPTNRVRKFHRRSKNGCATCRRRHVRCDERQPLCTNCLQNGSQCDYTLPAKTQDTERSLAHSRSMIPLRTFETLNRQPSCHSFVNSLVQGHSLPPQARSLFHQFANFSIRGQTPVERSEDVFAVDRVVAEPGLLHGSQIVAACQWAWTNGSLEHVKVPFLYHKSAAYELIRKQLLQPHQLLSQTTVFLIASLALAEGAVGDLDASSKHLRGMRELTRRRQGYNLQAMNIAQQMLEMATNRLQTGEVSVLYDAIGSDYRPSIIALLFASLWDMTSLPPRRAPRYGWWEAGESRREKLWQEYTKNLNWELSRDFDPERNLAMMLNGDPKSSRASYVATFFYLLSAMSDEHIDMMLASWLLEQLIDDIEITEKDMLANTFSRCLWLWLVLFGAAVAHSANALTDGDLQQVSSWRSAFSSKLRLVSGLLTLQKWENVTAMLQEVAWEHHMMGQAQLRRIWEEATSV